MRIEGGARDRIDMLVAAVNVLVVVTLILVSVISERAVRLVKQRLRRGVRLGAPSALTDARRTDIIVPRTEDSDTRSTLGNRQRPDARQPGGVNC